MALLVSIDNGGTLTDVYASDGATTLRVKTLTTPHNLTECLVNGLVTLSEALYGEADLARLVGDTDYIRYSTTEGTNAIVQRKGPRIGLLCDDQALVDAVEAGCTGLFEAFVADRVRIVSADGGEEARRGMIAAITDLVAAGTNRVVVGFAGTGAADSERLAKRLLYRAFPRHLLGAVPLLFSTELAKIGPDEKRVWAAVLNAFLHPAMERFLYNAENKLREQRAKKPMLVFRNDGNSTRVAKTVAIKTYSSGPQGGVVGGQVLLGHYGRKNAVSMDIGGTTTDIAVFQNGRVAVNEFGEIAGAPVPIPLSDVRSVGVGGGSVIRAVDGAIEVGPQSVGSAPGPACFGRGGTEATITDAFLVAGVLDAKSYFGGRLPLDRERGERAVMAHVGTPLGLDATAAVEAMAAAYNQKIADTVCAKMPADDGTILLAFGGAGPMSACGVAARTGLSEVLIPRDAAVFSAFGITFSDIQHTYVCPLPPGRDGEFDAAKRDLAEQARRGMLAEGFDLAECALTYALLTPNGAGYVRAAAAAPPPPMNRECFLELQVTRPIKKVALSDGDSTERRKAKAGVVRKGHRDLAVFDLESLHAGDWNEGPCLLEGSFFTTVVEGGWRFLVSGNRDVFLRAEGAGR